MPNPITHEEEKLIIKLWKERKTGSEIGAALGRSRNSIMGKLNRLRAKGVIELLPEGEVRFKSKTPAAPPVKVKKVPSMPKMPRLITEAAPEKTQPVERLFVAPPPQEEPSKPIRFKDLKANSCLYVVSGKRAEEFLFCGKRKENRSYCKDHAAIVYVKIGKQNPVNTFKLERMSGFMNK